VARPGGDVGRFDEVKPVDHLDVREVPKTAGRAGRDARPIQLDGRLDRTPVVVDGFAAAANDSPDGFQVDSHPPALPSVQ
jgi:hypothetical protein